MKKNIELVVGKPTENPKNCYELVVDSMMGDADSYPSHSKLYNLNNINDMKHIILLLSDVKNTKYNMDMKVLKKIFKKHYETYKSEFKKFENETSVEDMFYEFIDVHESYEFVSGVQSFDVYWYNDVGVKHHVDVVIK